MASKERSAPRVSRTRNTSAGSFASVKTKASMVAMSGAIMPEPLAMPLIVIVVSPIGTVRLAPLAKVSVVMMAWAAAGQAASLRSLFKAFREPVSRWSGRGSPITPVEARKTSLRRQPSSAVTASRERPTASAPRLPVKALALPALTSRARALPLRRAARHHSTGAEAVFERVRTPATVVPGTSSARQTSARSL